MVSVLLIAHLIPLPNDASESMFRTCIGIGPISHLDVLDKRSDPHQSVLYRRIPHFCDFSQHSELGATPLEEAVVGG